MIKSVKGNIIYALVIYIIIVGLSRAVDYGYRLYQSTNLMYPVVILSLATPFLLGISLGFEFLYKQIRKSGKWHYNITKIILLCIIPLIVAVLEALGSIKYIPAFVDTKLFIYLLCFTAGYSAVTSVYKKNTILYHDSNE